MPIPIAIAVVENGDRFLVGLRPAGVPLAGLWEFPGGKIRPGETPEDAAVRECLEETGLNIEPVARYPDHVEQYDHAQVLLFFIACRLSTQGGQEPRAPFRWVPRAVMANYKFPSGNRALLEMLTAGERPSDA